MLGDNFDASVRIKDVDGGATVQIGDDVLTLTGMTAANLSVDDFPPA